LAELQLLSNGARDLVLLGRDLRGVLLLDIYRRLPQGLDLERLVDVHDLPRLIGPLMDHARYGAEHLAVDLDWIVADPVVESHG